MKKITLLTFIAIILILQNSCSGNDAINNAESCWVFTTVTVTSVSGMSVPGYPETTTTTTEQCGLTEKQADDVCKQFTSTSTSTSGGMKVTVKTTTTKRKK